MKIQITEERIFFMTDICILQKFTSFYIIGVLRITQLILTKNKLNLMRKNDIKTDTLHLDIWDHDDESSVFEAAKKLNEVKGLKGLDRYFKQIAQSARTNKEETVDDFLGSVNINLDDLPSSGVEKWFELEGRSEKSKVEGKIKLRLNFSTKEDRGDTEENGTREVRQHETIIRLFIQYELKRPNVEKSSEWNGELSREAETILHQHCIQGDMNEFHIALSRWLAYSQSHLDKELSYQLLSQKLENLDKVWNSSSPSREETSNLLIKKLLRTKTTTLGERFKMTII
ncbi:BAI1-associated 3-like [Brachionus plicatilis]|uniref:BAI1-associated 3-like n=1 Tax=Brachionus plicatilis TaxID=10195 RepID=A0A3M7QFL1_BRAPC|nr:BAI1-associated 3-like [Brachionus plicatilis]